MPKPTFTGYANPISLTVIENSFTEWSNPVSPSHMYLKLNMHCDKAPAIQTLSWSPWCCVLRHTHLVNNANKVAREHINL